MTPTRKEKEKKKETKLIVFSKLPNLPHCLRKEINRNCLLSILLIKTLAEDYKPKSPQIPQSKSHVQDFVYYCYMSSKSMKTATWA